MSKAVDRKKVAPKRILREGEFISRTQKHISKVDTFALTVRSKGITALRTAVDNMVEMIRNASTNDHEDTLRASQRELLAAMNFSVADSIKELKKRGVKQ